jgi:hypothetical protein
MSINRRSITIMSASGTEMNKYSETVKGDSYYGYTDGFHTFQVTYNQFVGRLRIQATLLLDPQDGDWFDLYPTQTSGRAWNTTGFVQFNANDPGNGSEAYSFQGNFTFLRAYMDREHVADGETHDPSYGSIARVILSS